MKAAFALAAILLLPACAEETAGEDARLLRAARTGMNVVRGLPGGKTASFTQVRLVGDRVVCGMIDGNDGFGTRPFSVVGEEAAVADTRDPATVAAVEKTCSGGPVREIRSRNPQFSDLEVAR